MHTTDHYQGNDKLLFGMILGVLAFWLFAQTTLNINVDMAKDLGMQMSLMNIAVSITALFSGIFVVVFGTLADTWGRVKMVRLGFYFSIAGSLLVAATPTGDLAAPILIAGRILQGLSAAAVMPASLSLVKTYWHGKERQRAISMWSMGSWGGGGFTSLFSGLMIDIGWRYIFLIAAIASVIGLLMIRGTPESKVPRKANQKQDLLGIILFMIAMLSLQILVTKGVEIGIATPVGLGLLISTIFFCCAFIWIEIGRENTFIDFNIFKNKTFTGATLSNLMLNGTAGMLFVSLALLQLGGNLSAKSAGLLTLGYAIAIVLFIRIGEKLLQRFGTRQPMIWGPAIVGVSIAILMYTNVMLDTYKIMCIVAYSLFGIGLGFYATPSTDAALANLPEDQIGAGAGIYKMASSLGSALGVAISAGVFTALNAQSDVAWVNGLIHFVGRQDNIVTRVAAAFGLGVNLLMVIFAILAVIVLIPKNPAPRSV